MSATTGNISKISVYISRSYLQRHESSETSIPETTYQIKWRRLVSKLLQRVGSNLGHQTQQRNMSGSQAVYMLKRNHSQDDHEQRWCAMLRKQLLAFALPRGQHPTDLPFAIHGFSTRRQEPAKLPNILISRRDVHWMDYIGRIWEHGFRICFQACRLVNIRYFFLI